MNNVFWGAVNFNILSDAVANGNLDSRYNLFEEDKDSGFTLSATDGFMLNMDNNGKAFIFDDLAFGQTDRNERIGSDTTTTLDLHATNSIELHDATNIGEGTNEVQFAFDRYRIMKGDARAKVHFIESATLAGIGMGAGNAASANARNNTAVVTYASGGLQPKEAFFIFHIPDNMDITENLLVHIHWAPATNAAGNVNWQMDWLAMESENNELINAAATTANVVDAAQTTAFELLETDNMIIPAASLSLEDTLSIRIFRDAGTAPDTYGADADLVLVEYEYVKDKDGEHL